MHSYISRGQLSLRQYKIRRALNLMRIAISISLQIGCLLCRQESSAIAQNNLPKLPAPPIETIEPDIMARTFAKKVSANDIEHIRIDVSIVHMDYLDMVDIKDVSTIQSILNALKTATSLTKNGQMLTNGPDYIQFFFKPKNGKAQEPVQFNFFGGAPDLSFGPEFQHILEKIQIPEKKKYEAELKKMKLEEKRKKKKKHH